MALHQNSRDSKGQGGSKAPSETGNQANNPQQPGVKEPQPKEGDIRKVQWSAGGREDGKERSEDEIMEEEAQREKENLMDGKEDEY